MKSRLFTKIEHFRNKTKSTKFTTKLIFLFAGISSTIWFLIRVIPKPQRAGYPCMRAAAPAMSAFVLYLISLGGSVLFFKKAISKFRQGRYIIASLALILSVGLVTYFAINDAEDVLANNDNTAFTRGTFPDDPNTVIGEAWGVFPGRVAWAHDPEATNENCDNIVVSTGGGWFGGVMDDDATDAFFQAKNNNQEVINEMADKTIKAIGGQPTIEESWDAIFASFNNKRKSVDAGYTEGQTIFIKINNGQAGHAINSDDLSERGYDSSTGVKSAAITETSPAVVLAYVRQLVDECNIPQNMIYIAEPMTHVYKSVYDAIHNEYPDIIILDKDDRSDLGRTKTAGWQKAIKYSDKGDIMPNGIEDAIMKEMYNADYLINIAALKAHARNGVTLTAKQHFGSHGSHNGKWDSFDLHPGLISVDDNDKVDRPSARTDYGMYRVMTDLMGNKKLGLNTVLFIVDGLWGGIEATDMPVWWWSEPFDGDFPNSLFVSQDAVALECVCIDFLRAEADVNDDFNDRPFFPAVDDHLRQAASKDYWADGITYDPEDDGTEMPASIGVYEHWNNEYDKQYTKNLDPLATNGIELFNPEYFTGTGVSKIKSVITDINVFPNPCTDYAEVNFSLEKDATVEFSVVNTSGQTIQKYSPEQQFAGTQSFRISTSTWISGNYIIVMKSTTNTGSDVSSARLVVN